MIVLVIAVVAYWLFQLTINPTAEEEIEPVDYLAVVSAAQDGGIDLVYPSSLPDGWIATDVRLDRAEGLTWSLPMLTAACKYVGLQVEDAKLADLITTYVDDDAMQGSEASIDSGVATTWSTWSDSGGDHAFAAEVGDSYVLVYGYAPVADLETVVRSLTTAPVG